jgi:hypothetical protein
MRPDYPAAHSMDTVWFAVDREGHVAAFGSGEAGAVPGAGYLGEEWGTTVEAIKVLPKTADTVKDEEMEDAVLNHGVFFYGHEKTENLTAGPYTQMKPANPVKIDQLPPEIREVVGQVKFDTLSFATAKEIQPIDHFPCEAWGASYLADDKGTIKPIPGREGDYAEEFQQFSTDLPEYHWIPPVPGARNSKPDPAAGVRVGNSGAKKANVIFYLILIAIAAALLMLKVLIK